MLVVSGESIERDDLWMSDRRSRSTDIDSEIGISIRECADNEQAEQENRAHFGTRPTLADVPR